jgi:ATP-dependent DNA helicase RecQ
LQRYFKGRQKILGLATSESSWKKIVESLHNPDQERIVQAPTEQNLLVLAGPGAGKTRVIVHRCAYLVRVCQVAPERILVLSFNHNAALSLRRRLHELLGSDARRLAVHTFHGLALRLTGQSLAERKNEPPDFDALLEQSIQLLEGGQLQLGDEQESQREQLLGGLEYLLVDEYQDIDERQYRLIAALVGRQLQDDEVRLRLMAVGDDDQSIYQFRQANVTFIRRFREDYEAELHYLTQNYRSSGHIITAANSLITHNRDRMKGEHPITIDHGRRLAPDGGDWQERDPLGRGRVEWWHCADLEHQAQALVALVERIRAQDPDCLPEQIAVLSRHGLDKEVLILARSALSRAGVPCRFVLDREQGFPLHRCRELVRYRDWLTGLERQLVDAAQLLGELPAEGERNHWQQLLADLVEQWRQSHGEQGLPAWMVLVGLNEYLLEQRRQVRFGRGLLLSTVHGVKGEEFRHVVVLDGGWQAAARQPEQGEEECRLYYVAMTRAIERLYLFQAGTEGSHPHLHRLDPGAFFRAPVPLRRPAEPTLRYSLLGMVQLFLDHAGRLPADHSAHGILAQLEVGDEVTLSSGERGEVLVLCQGRVVACLSRAAAGQWRSRLGQVRKAEVVALIQRRREDVKEDYFKAIKTELWYLPILQLCWQESAEGGERHPQPEPFSAR